MESKRIDGVCCEMAAADAADDGDGDGDGDSFSVGVVIALPSSPSLSLEYTKKKKKKQKKNPVIINQEEEEKLMMSKSKDKDGDADATDVGRSISNNKKKRKQDNNDQTDINKCNANNNKLEKFRATASASCSFPMRRAWRLVRGEAGNADNKTTHEAVFLINKASEMFLQRFAQEAYSNAQRDRKRSITYHHLSSTVCNGRRYDFLSDFVPEKVKAEAALKARALAEPDDFRS